VQSTNQSSRWEWDGCFLASMALTQITRSAEVHRGTQKIDAVSGYPPHGCRRQVDNCARGYGLNTPAQQGRNRGSRGSHVSVPSLSPSATTSFTPGIVMHSECCCSGIGRWVRQNLPGTTTMSQFGSIVPDSLMELLVVVTRCFDFFLRTVVVAARSDTQC